MEKEKMSVEEAFAQLDEIVQRLESEEIPLEESFRVYQKGMELLKYCSQKLDTVEKKMLQMDEDGTLREF